MTQAKSLGVVNHGYAHRTHRSAKNRKANISLKLEPYEQKQRAHARRIEKTYVDR